MPRRPVVNPVMRPTDLPLNQTLGIIDAPAAAEHLLELPLSLLVSNHLGSIHAAAQFALAEAASAERLRRDYGDRARNALVVVRGASVKYRRPATGKLLAFARLDETTARHLSQDLATRSRTIATVLVELKDLAGNLTFAGGFDWFVGRPEHPGI